MRTQWTITKDNTAEPGATPGTNINAVGTVGPHSATLTAAEIVAHPDAKQFRLLDDDGTVYYEGYVVGEDEFAPLDDFGEANAGCTVVEILEDGFWQPL